MICPHCRKPIEWVVDKKVFALAKKLRAEGYSLRDMEVVIRAEGYHVSFGTLGKYFRGEIKEFKQ